MSTLDKPSQAPSLLSYPEVLTLNDVKEEIVDQFCYVIKQYPLNGISVLIKLNHEEMGTVIRIGDWNGNALKKDSELKKYEDIFLSNYSIQFLELCMNAKIEQIQFYMSCQDDSITLVDARTSINNMVSPGYIKDIFGKIMPSQQIIGNPKIMSKDILDSIEEKTIIKPSLFKTIIRNNKMFPLYALT